MTIPDHTAMCGGAEPGDARGAFLFHSTPSTAAAIRSGSGTLSPLIKRGTLR